MPDKMSGSIMQDGTIRLVTDSISPANHASADEVKAEIIRLGGGKATTEERNERHSHALAHDHEHEHSW